MWVESGGKSLEIFDFIYVGIPMILVGTLYLMIANKLLLTPLIQLPIM